MRAIPATTPTCAAAYSGKLMPTMALPPLCLCHPAGQRRRDGTANRVQTMGVGSILVQAPGSDARFSAIPQNVTRVRYTRPATRMQFQRHPEWHLAVGRMSVSGPNASMARHGYRHRPPSRTRASSTCRHVPRHGRCPPKARLPMSEPNLRTRRRMAAASTVEAPSASLSRAVRHDSRQGNGPSGHDDRRHCRTTSRIVPERRARR